MPGIRIKLDKLSLVSGEKPLIVNEAHVARCLEPNRLGPIRSLARDPPAYTSLVGEWYCGVCVPPDTEWRWNAAGLAHAHSSVLLLPDASSC